MVYLIDFAAGVRRQVISLGCDMLYVTAMKQATFHRMTDTGFAAPRRRFS